MKKSFILIIVLLLGVLWIAYSTTNVKLLDESSFSTQTEDSLDAARQVTYLNELEKDVVLEMNMARTDPAAYAEQYIKPHWSIPAARECYYQMIKTKPMGILQPCKGISQAAKVHAEDCRKHNFFKHEGSDNSSFTDRMERFGTYQGQAAENMSAGYDNNNSRNIVVQLLIDDGVPSRGHRNTILNFDLFVVGVACGMHPEYQFMCVMDYATEFIEEP
ncbi:MAG: CAP domain-containing protein [Bacteroidales bacterium]|nr:CAP domain-containing protein [Bacteroidales bacterium]